MKKAFIISTVIAALTVPAVVYAAKEFNEYKHQRIEKMFEKYDANKDGGLSKDELPGRMSERFEKMDTDKDGLISQKEAHAAHKRMKEMHMANFMMELDTDSDGELSEAEVTAFVQGKFRKADKDGNGKLTMEEISEARHMMKKDWKGRHGHRG